VCVGGGVQVLPLGFSQHSRHMVEGQAKTWCCKSGADIVCIASGVLALCAFTSDGDVRCGSCQSLYSMCTYFDCPLCNALGPDSLLF
jgi:hypothetical protein